MQGIHSVRISKCLFLSCIVVLSAGCSVYRISPELEQVQDIQPITIDSYSLQISEKTKIWTRSSILSKTKDVLSTSALLDSVPIKKTPYSQDYFHLDIDVQYWHGGAGGDAFISALSLGLIPTWGENSGIFKYRFNLYRNGELHRTKSYSVNEEYYSHLILLPFALIDNLFFNHPTNIYRQALVENTHITSSSNGQNMLSPFLQKNAKKLPTNIAP
mgnify:CR=1 FL=1